MPHFMIVLIPYINLLNIFLKIKCLFLRTKEPLTSSLVVKMCTVLVSTISTSQVFLLKKCE